LTWVLSVSPGTPTVACGKLAPLGSEPDIPTNPSTPRIVRFGVFEVDLAAGEVRKAGLRQRLAGQPFQLLEALLERPGEVVTRDDLRQRIWPKNTVVDYELALKKAVNRLREVLGDSAESPHFIETVPRRGYRFIGSVTRPSESSEQRTGVAIPPPTLSAATDRRGFFRKLTAGFVLLALLAILLWFNAGKLSTRIFARPRPQEIHSIAVLPLENLSHDADQEYFSDGMTDVLITDLAKIHALRVISRNSIMPYKGIREPLPKIARELNVDAVVEGTVTRSGDRVRITAQLIDAAHDRHLWADTYEGDLRDILGLQDRVARAIAGQIRVHLTPEEQVRLTTNRSVDPQAQDAYLTGRYYWNRRATEAVRKSCDYFRQAIDKDPAYAAAYAGLADCYSILGYYHYDTPAATFALGKIAAQKALQMDESLAEAHASLAFDEHYYDFDWTGAETEFKRAIELNPNYATAHHWYALYLSEAGRFAEAKAEIRRAHELDPLSPIIGNTIAAVFYFSREYDLGIEQLRGLLDEDPNFVVAHDLLGKLYLQKEMYGAAISEFEKAMALDPGDSSILLEIATTHALAGHKTEAKKVFQRVQDVSKREYVPEYDVAQFYTSIGQPDWAFDSLQRAFKVRDRTLTFLGVDPLLDSLRSDPRFAELLRRVGPPQ
jgi:TolB-like protein/DNA-binding winged helix-turn-helix (wHTH) protein/Flp pilus assembly protein TadD